MAYGNPSIDQYRKSAVNSASPLQLVILLYDGALKFMEAGKHAMSHGDLYKQNENCQKAQNILTELMSCLDMNRGGEIAQSLYALYSFAFDRLVDANLTDSPVGIDQAIKVLTDLRASWCEIEKAGADKARAA